MTVVAAIVSLILAYLLGSLPTGVLAARLVRGVEVRQIGSGRTGATNVYRAAGPLGLALTTLGDILKGILSVWVTRLLLMFFPPADPSSVLSVWVETAAGIAAVAGHNWSVFLGFKGGAGTATTMGVLAAMNVYVAIGVAAIGLSAIAVSQMASVGSITVAIAMGPALAIAAATLIAHWAYVPFGILGGALTLVALLPNVRRILDGQERRLRTN